MFRVRPSRPSRRSASFEPLERRSLMSATVDLTVADTGFSDAANQPSPVPGCLFYIQPTFLEDGHAPTTTIPYSIYAAGRTVPYSIYLSPTPSLSNQSVRIDYNPWGGPSVNKVATGGLPPDITPGTWYPIVVVDPDNTIPESDESNNIAVAHPITVALPHDDLVPPPFSALTPGATSPSAPAGSTLYVSVDPPYPGALYPVSVRYSLSADDVAGNSDDIPLDTVDLPRFNSWDPGGQIGRVGIIAMPQYPALHLPASLPAGTYHVVSTVDPDNAIAEPDETNNTALGPVVTVLSASTVDLSPGVFLTGPTSLRETTTAAPGSQIKLGAYANSVYGQDLRPKVSFVLSANNILGDDDDILLGSYETGVTTPIPPGVACVDYGPPPTLDVTLPSNLTPGHYKIFAVIDPDNQIAETNESNNVSPGRDLTITDGTTPPDSRPINWSSNENPPPGGPIYTLFPSINPQSTVTSRNITAGSSAKTSVTLTNPSGKSTTTQFKVAFYFSSDDKLTRNDQRFATQTITVALRPHQTKTQQITYKIPPSTKSGQRYVITTFTPLRPSTTVVQSSPPPTLLNVQPKTTSLKSRPLSKQMLYSDQPHA